MAARPVLSSLHPQRQNNKAMTQAKSKFLLLHSPTHHVHSLAQILSSPEVSLPLLSWSSQPNLVLPAEPRILTVAGSLTMRDVARRCHLS